MKLLPVTTCCKSYLNNIRWRNYHTAMWRIWQSPQPVSPAGTAAYQ